MKNELQQHKKSDSFKWILTLIAFLLVGATLAGMLLGYLTPRTVDKEPIQQEQEASVSDSGFKSKFVNTQNVKLMSVTPMAAVANESYVEQTVSATVLPETATNKMVDWSVSWADSSNTSNVTDYVSVTPASNGSTTAYVRCYQSFSGDAIVTVTTRESGYTAEIIVSFVGIPTDLTVTGQFTENSDGFYYIGVGETYDYNVELSNIFNTIGEDYQDINVTFGGYGSVVLCTYEYYSQSGTSKWYDNSLNTVTVESLKDKFMNVSYADGVLSITTIKTIESYYESMSRIDGGRTRSYENKFKEYATEDAYLYIRIDQPSSGLSKLMKIKFDTSVVTGVNVNDTALLF